MKDREIVRNAYRLILGREPESETVLDRQFENIFTLRNEFISSDEFKNLISNDFNIKSKLIISNFEELDNFIKEFKNIGYKNMKQFCSKYTIDFNNFYSIYGQRNPYIDNPFSDEYKKWEMDFFEFLSGKKYLFENEGFPEIFSKHPEASYSIEAMIGRYKNYTDLIILLGNIKGKRVLEMGCGRGRLAIFFESIGCDYYAVDASINMVDTTKKLIFSEKIKTQILNKSFYEIGDFNIKFEYIIFEASFHHVGEAIKLLEMINNNSTNNAKIIFLREPIYDWYDRPWGVVRGDPETLLQTRMRGWLELGYRRDFFNDLLKKTGWKIKEKINITFENNEVFIAEKN